jgi:hypothetical protein
MLSTNYKFSRFFEFAGWLFSKTLSPSDKISLHTTKKLLRASPFVYQSLTEFLSEDVAAKALFIAINLATVVYQYGFASWFMYLLTSMSGLRKLFSVVLQNPMLGVFFYLSFYFRLISETDSAKFNMMAEALHLPMHEDFVGSLFLTTLLTNVASLVSNESVSGYEGVVQKLIRKLISEQVLAPGVERLPSLLNSLLTRAAQNPDLKLGLSVGDKSTAVYVEERNEESQSDLEEFREFVSTNRKAIEERIRTKNKSKKRAGKLQLQKVLEKRDSEGQVICLDTCKKQTKTKVGCYCDGECGPTFLLGKESWCFVDPSKCKKAKYLPRYMGRTYDKCDVKNVGSTLKPMCFTGFEYKECESRKK